MEQKTVFISYRRSTSKHLARSIYMELKSHGWDVFFDVNTIDSGDFDRIILNQIGARAHFILLVSEGSLARCANAGDWVLCEIQEAVRLERNIVPIVEEGASFSKEVGYLPSELGAIVGKKNALPLPHFFFDAAMDMLRTRFLKTPEYVRIAEPPAAERAEVARRMADVNAETSTTQRPRSESLLSAPFAWVEILGGNGKMKTDESVVLDMPTQRYWISKYPVTNAQFAKFIEADGYKQRKWWTEAGWTQREQSKWTQPRFWTDAKWNSAVQPVVGVSWHEAVAFCFWLSEVTGENISLPTEQQWQFAAQGTDGRAYPWGNDWDCARCNNSASPCDSNVTTPVTAYEGKGDSPFGVVDMAGNVWEWCLTDHATGANNKDIMSNQCIMRGGASDNDNSGWFLCDCRNRSYVGNQDSSIGFRLARF